MRWLLVLVLAGLMGQFLPPPGLRAQVQRLAPPIPAGRTSLPFVLSYPDAGPVPGSQLHVYRMGHGGSIEQPRSVALPDNPSALVLAAWDWLRPRGRDIEVAVWDPYRVWLRVESESDVVAVSDSRWELVRGSVVWQDGRLGARQRALSSGAVSVTGRGTARIDRHNGVVTVQVLSGRFEVERPGDRPLRLGAGQQRDIPLPGERPGSLAFQTDTMQAFESLQEHLDDILVMLLGAYAQGLEPIVDGATLAVLWERLLLVLPLYARAEAELVSWLPHPDIRRREIGEALRFLSSFRYTPPPPIGM